MKKILKILKWVLIVLIAFIVVINIPVLSIRTTVSDTDYSNWMSNSLVNDKRAIDITMLGAHDAFSSEINYFSPLDEYSSSDIMQGTLGALLKGFILRQSVTQTASPTELLQSGVRYFDVRLSYTDGVWETKHNYVSSDFEDVALEMTTFLTENKGEFLILDFQHIHGIDYSSDEDYQLFYEMLEEYGIINYSYDSLVKPLSEITYGDLTNDNTVSRVIIIDKFESENKSTFLYSSTVQSNWADNDDFEETISFLVEEANAIKSLDYPINKFVVMQGVTTMQMDLNGILASFNTWSLIKRAELFNNHLFNAIEFNEMIDSMPIIMVDYANSNDEGFNDAIMELVIQKAHE